MLLSYMIYSVLFMPPFPEGRSVFFFYLTLSPKNYFCEEDKERNKVLKKWYTKVAGSFLIFAAIKSSAKSRSIFGFKCGVIFTCKPMLHYAVMNFLLVLVL